MLSSPPKLSARLIVLELLCVLASSRVAQAAADRFATIQAFAKDSVPVSGNASTAFAAVDEAILNFMVAKRIPAASFALSKNGQLLFSRAYGWDDAELTTPFHVGESMRLASLSKSITQAAIRALFTRGLLKPDDRVFDVLKLQAPASPAVLDPRWKDVTIQNLLEHKGGWDRAKSGDFTYHSKAVAAELRVPLQDLQPMDLVSWALARPLDFAPGSREAYSNFGYILLARVVEKISGQDFLQFLHDTVAQTAGMTTLRLSRSDAEDRQPGETWYCLTPEFLRPERPLSLRMETQDGCADLACSAEDYCRFLEHYAINGQLRRPGGRYWGVFYGSTPGVTSVCVQRLDGLCYTAICNRRPKGAEPEAWNKELKAAIDHALGTKVDKM